MIKPHFYTLKALLKKYKDYIHALLFAFFIEISLLLFIFYYPLKMFYPYETFSEGGLENEAPTLYYPHDIVQGHTLDPTQLPEQNAEKSDTQDALDSADDITQDSTDLSTTEDESLAEPNLTKPNIDTLEMSTEQDTSSNLTIPEIAIPDNRQLDKTPEKTAPRPRRVRKVRKIIKRRRKRKVSPTARIFNRESLARARKEVYKNKANYRYGSPNGTGSRYAYVTQRLNREKMFSYSCKVGKILQSEFARNRTPIVFEEDLKQSIPGTIIINRDGTVKDYICENPTGVKEFDDYIKRVIMQSKFTPLPKHYAEDTHEIPFPATVEAHKGTNVFRLHLPEDKPDYLNQW